MTRRILTIVVFLLLGAIVNVAVAWGFVLAPKTPRLVAQPQAERTDEIDVPRQLELLRFQLAVTEYRDCRLGFSLTERQYKVQQVPHTRSTFQLGTVHAVTAGGPLNSLCGRYSRVPQFEEQSTNEGILSVDGHPLPLRPVWPGFAINTLFYAGILWVVFATPFALRHRRRIRRGLCPTCAYPVGESTACTECGAPVHPKNQ